MESFDTTTNIANDLVSQEQLTSQYTQAYPTEKKHSGATYSYLPKSKKKRQQVKNACVNCQKACKKCDESRPCSRCIKYGLTDTCADSPRKARKKGVKRGPYKRRKAQGDSLEATRSNRNTPNNISTMSGIHHQSMTKHESTPGAHNSSYRPYLTYPLATFGGAKESVFTSGQGKGASSQIPSTYPTYPGNEYESLALLSYFYQGGHDTASSLRRLVNPQVQTLQTPQSRRLSVDLPAAPRVGLTPRAYSADPDSRNGQGQDQSQASTRLGQESRRKLTIEVPTLPSISTITSRVNQPPTPAPVLPPLKNVPMSMTSHDEELMYDQNEGEARNMKATTTRKGSVGIDESEGLASALATKMHILQE